MRRLALGAATFGISAALTLFLAEALLRMAGHAPDRFEHPNPHEPIIHEPDPALGWRSRPGRHRFPPYRLPGTPFHKTILPDGRRATAHEERSGRPELVVVGCSYSLGWAVDDADTWAWRLQERLPELRVLNFATAGYGTYQSLLTLERVLPELSRPEWVVYGMIQHHKERNVADADWLRTLDRVARDGPAAVPWVSVDEEGELVRHPPRRYPRPPLHGVSALVRFATRLYLERNAREEAGKREITERLLLEMQRFAADHGARFAVALLEFPDARKEAAVRDFLGESGIPVLDCSRRLGPGLRVPGEGHPNARMHGFWGDCIAAALRTQPDGEEPLARIGSSARARRRGARARGLTARAL
jgi:hypothetical protein